MTMVNEPVVQRPFPEKPQVFSLIRCCMVLGILSMRAVCAPLAQLPVSVAAPETIHEVLGMEAGQVPAKLAGKPSKTYVGGKTGPEADPLSERVLSEQHIWYDPDFVSPVRPVVSNLDESAFSSATDSKIVEDFKPKSLKDLPSFRHSLRGNSYLNDRTIALKDQLLVSFNHINKVMESQQKDFNSLQLENVNLANELLFIKKDIKALILQNMRKIGGKKARSWVRSLKYITETTWGKSSEEWQTVVSEAEKEYEQLYGGFTGLIAEIFKRFFQGKKWREQRMLKDFHSVRVTALEGKLKLSPRHQTILRLEELRSSGISISGEDQDLIHKIASKLNKVKLRDEEAGRFEVLEAKVRQLLNSEKTKATILSESEHERWPEMAYVILKTKPESEMKPEEQILFKRLKAHSANLSNPERDLEHNGGLTLSREEELLIQKYASEYRDKLSHLKKYSNPRSAQGEELGLDGKGFDIETRAREVLEYLSEKGKATEVQKEFLARMKTEDDATSEPQSEELKSIANAFWVRQKSLFPQQKAQWVTKIITPELRHEFSIKETFLERMKDLLGESQLDHRAIHQINHLAKIHDETIASMSSQERAFHELVARELDRGQQSGSAVHAEQLPEQLQKVKDGFRTMLEDAFRKVSYARLHWNPTMEEKALERLTDMQHMPETLSEDQNLLLKKLQKNQLLTDEERAIIKQLAIESVVLDISKISEDVQELAIKLCREANLEDLTQNNLAWFQNLKHPEIGKLTRLGPLPLDHPEFRVHSKFSQIAQILKRASERHSLDMTPGESYGVYSVGKNEMEFMKTEIAEAHSRQWVLADTLNGLKTFKAQRLNHGSF